MKTWTWYEVRNTEAGEQRRAIAYGSDADVPRIDEQLLKGYAPYSDMAVIRVDSGGSIFPAGAQDPREAPPLPGRLPPPLAPPPQLPPAPAPSPPSTASIHPALLVVVALGIGYLLLK